MPSSDRKVIEGDILTYIKPIFDRAETDILKLKYFFSKGYKNLTADEKNEWLNTNFKGALNVSDLNRIEQNMSVLADMLGTQVQTKVWQETDIPTNNDFKRIKDNLIKIRNLSLVHSSTPQVPDLPWNLYQKINDIEKIISDIYKIYSSQSYYYCGQELYCGEN